MALCYGIQNFLLVVMYYVRLVRMVVPEYCLQPLNTNDCGLKPTAVMTYWKPGSRCEIEVWRGCPTVNKFDDEYKCSTTCIFQAHKPEARSQEPEEKDECKEIMIDKKCADFEQEVYTFKDGLCVPTVWRGCPTLNKFINSTVCNNTCTQNWLDQLGNLNLASLEIINEILDGIIENSSEIAESSGSEDKSVEQPDSVKSENEIVNHVNEKPESNGSSEDGSKKESESTSVEPEISNGEEINTEPKDAQDEHITNEPTEIKQTFGVARPSVFIDPRYKHNNM